MHECVSARCAVYLSTTVRGLIMWCAGKSATFTTAEGLRIACLGGTYDPNIYHGSELPQVCISYSPAEPLAEPSVGLYITVLQLADRLEVAFKRNDKLCAEYISRVHQFKDVPAPDNMLYPCFMNRESGS